MEVEGYLEALGGGGGGGCGCVCGGRGEAFRFFGGSTRPYSIYDRLRGQAVLTWFVVAVVISLPFLVLVLLQVLGGAAPDSE